MKPNTEMFYVFYRNRKSNLTNTGCKQAVPAADKISKQN